MKKITKNIRKNIHGEELAIVYTVPVSNKPATKLFDELVKQINQEEK